VGTKTKKFTSMPFSAWLVAGVILVLGGIAVLLYNRYRDANTMCSLQCGNLRSSNLFDHIGVGLLIIGAVVLIASIIGVLRRHTKGSADPFR